MPAASSGDIQAALENAHARQTLRTSEVNRFPSDSFTGATSARHVPSTVLYRQYPPTFPPVGGRARLTCILRVSTLARRVSACSLVSGGWLQLCRSRRCCRCCRLLTGRAPAHARLVNERRPAPVRVPGRQSAAPPPPPPPPGHAPPVVAQPPCRRPPESLL